jgi:N-acetylglucosamine-6-phosphate deacetylase
VAKFVQMTGVGLADAIDLATAQPRRLLGLAPRTIEPGQPADFVMLDGVEVKATVVAGQRC